MFRPNFEYVSMDKLFAIVDQNDDSEIILISLFFKLFSNDCFALER